MAPDRFLIWGAGGHAKVVADLVRACRHQVAGFVDADAARVGQVVGSGSERVIFEEQELLDTVCDHGQLPGEIDAVALAIGSNVARQACLDLLPRIQLPALVHPSAVVSPSAMLGRGTVVLPVAVINADARVGSGVIVNSAAVVEHDCVLADAVHVSPGAVLAGGVRVGPRSWIGAGATVIQGITIGSDAIIGAGAVVIRDVPDGENVVGVPAKPIRRR